MQKRRVRGDLIQVFTILKGVDKLDYSNFFEIQSSSRTRGHNYKLLKHRSRLDIRKKNLGRALLMFGTVCHKLL